MSGYVRSIGRRLRVLRAIKACGQKLKFNPVNTKDGIVRIECYL